MGIGIWYEMVVSDPVAYLFKNAESARLARSNVGNSTVRCLSNMKLGDMLTNRHLMSQDGAHGSVAAVTRLGLQPWLGLYPQGTFPRCWHDQTD